MGEDVQLRSHNSIIILRNRNTVLTSLCFIVLISSGLIGISAIETKSIGVEQVDGEDLSSAVYQHPLPILKDPRLKVEIAADGLTVPTGILILDEHNMLVLQRYTSSYPLGGITTVGLITDGHLHKEPVLRVLSGLCDTKNPKPGCKVFNERGLLGIAARKINPNSAVIAGNLEVFLYYTEITLNGEILGNRVYKYLWDGHQLINPFRVLDLPGTPGPDHNGGKILIGPDGYLYAVIGDKTIANEVFPIHEDPKLIKKLIRDEDGHRGLVQNIKDGSPPDNTSGIFRVNADNGMPAPDNPFMNNNTTNASNITSEEYGKLSRYYAYGLRNSFGLAFDPVTGNLWDTENGEFQYDEINLVEPGFNSGWTKVMGPMNRINATETDIRAYGFETWKDLKLKSTFNVTEDDLVNFPGSKYSDPEFSWKDTVGVTALGFLNSSKLGEKYANNLFVGDYIYGNLYFFKMNKNRDGVEFNNNQTDLSDLVADNAEERSKIVLGTGFDTITDIQTGPDGYLYILSYSDYSRYHPDNISRIYRIIPQT